MIFLDRHGQSYVGVIGTAAISALNDKAPAASASSCPVRHCWPARRVAALGAGVVENSTSAAIGAEAGAVWLLGLQVTLAELITYPALLLVAIGGGACAIR